MAKAKGSPKTGGRQKGTPNKDVQELFDICAKYDCDPFEGMVILAATESDPDKKFERLKEIAPYLYAKRKQVDVGIDPEKSTIRIIVEEYGKK